MFLSILSILVLSQPNAFGGEVDSNSVPEWNVDSPHTTGVTTGGTSGTTGTTGTTGSTGVDLSIDRPGYWSHTNSRVVVSAVPTGGTQGIIAWAVQVGYDVPYMYDGSMLWYQYGLSEAEVGFTIMFDSTQWQSGDDLEVTFSVKTTSNPTQWQSISHTATIWNVAGIYSDPQLQFDGRQILEDGYDGMNYQSFVRDGEWDFDQYKEDLLNTTAIDLNVHGNTMTHGDGLINPEEWIGFGEYANPNNQTTEPIEEKIGEGLPPFNSGGPPLQFVHLNACNCGEDDRWEQILYPGMNAYSASQIEDQAILAYTVFTGDAWHDEMSDALMEMLTAGDAVYFGRLNIYDRGETYVSDTDGGTWRLIELADMVIFGDQTTRLTTVYTGTLFSPEDDDIGEPKRHYRMIAEE